MNSTTTTNDTTISSTTIDATKGYCGYDNNTNVVCSNDHQMTSDGKTPSITRSNNSNQTCSVHSNNELVNENTGTGSRRNLTIHSIESSSFKQEYESEGENNSTVDGAQQQQQPKQRDQATKTVLQLKLMVLSILVCSAIAVGVGTYMYLQRSEQTKFYEVYQDDAKKLAQSLYGGVINTLAALDLLVTAFIAHADANNDTFPFVTLPHFANHAAKALSMSAGMSVWTVMLVAANKRKAWEKYAWSHRSMVNDTVHIMDVDPNYYGPIPWDVPMQYSLHDDSYVNIPYNESRQYAPVWMLYPLQADGFTAFNWDWFTDVDPDAMHQAIDEKLAILGEVYILPNPDDPDDVASAEYWADLFSGSVSPGDNPNEPVSDIIYPIINNIDKIQIIENVTIINNNTDADMSVVGAMSASFYWRDVMKNILPTGKRGLILVVDNPCTASFTYQIDGPRTIFLGRGDLHDPKYDDLVIQKRFADLYEFNTVKSEYTGIPMNPNYCMFQIRFYPSYDMEQQFTSSNPAIFASVAILIFVFTSIVFIIYDINVERRQQVVSSTAARSNAVLSSLFPSNVRDKLLQQESNNINSFHSSAEDYLANTNRPKNNTFRSILNNGSKQQDTSMIASQPIADLYSDTTVFFADICGFTAWSSTRGPDQVFILLESLYGEFDKIARFHRVFKVETIGDSYVAVAGLPDPMKTHATTMVKFSQDVLQKMITITHDLITTLGPDTADLKMRVGLNSGPTTAGVIRGEKSRFQLFGDTVNTASRMESTGHPNRIQCSPKTAELIRKAGKGHWLSKREEMVAVKGKGSMETYWVQTSHSKSIATTLSNTGSCDVNSNVGNSIIGELVSSPSKSELESQRQQNLIEWHIDLFSGLLMEISASRPPKKQQSLKRSLKSTPDVPLLDAASDMPKRLPLHEVAEVIEMAAYRSCDYLNTQGKNDQLDPVVLVQLSQYISTISKMYQNNPFHNFEHASHIVMSTKLLLDRMTGPWTDNEDPNKYIGIDPLARFAIVFGVLIHDVDHQGVSNFQLVNEKAALAVCYENRCVAEQNSFELAWRLLIQPNFSQLRQAIFTDDDSYKRFRQIVINVVMATDIFDKELNTLRDNRWELAFMQEDESAQPPNSGDHSNRKTTILFEYLVQASDVIHTMQHWSVYQKWNHRLFCEMCIAHRQGRSTSNPCDNWYENELEFFDNYIIPLAKRLKACNIFGANCDAFLDFANDNRMEWETKGQGIVTEWISQLDLLDPI